MRDMVCHSQKVGIDDDFVQLSLGAQALYYALAYYADIDGAITGPVSVCRMIGAPPSALTELIAKGFLLDVGGVLFDAHWWVNNNKGAMHYERYKNHVPQLRLLDVPSDGDAPAPYRLKAKPGMCQVQAGGVPGVGRDGAGPMPGMCQVQAGGVPGVGRDGAGHMPGMCQPKEKKRKETKPGNEGKRDNLASRYRKGQACPACKAGRLVPDDSGLTIYCENCGYVADSAL